jgi:hypothetical protein
MDSKKLEDKETIEEISAVGTGAVEVGAVAKKTDKEDEKEEKFRLMIREMLSIYFSKKEEKRKQSIFEEKLRSSIRKLLTEKESKEAAPESTLVGILRSLLNNIVPQIRLEYIKLQTNSEERQGFKDYFYNAVNKIMEINNEEAVEKQQPEELEEESLKIKRSEKPGFIDDVLDGTEEDEGSQDNNSDNKEKSQNDIKSYYERGQNFGESAFNAIRDRIENVVAAQIVPDEYQQFVKVLNDNLEAWFEIWDQNTTKDEPVQPETDTPEQEEGDLSISSLEESEIDFD